MDRRRYLITMLGREVKTVSWRTVAILIVMALALIVGGCGGGIGPPLPPGAGQGEMLAIGPMLVRPASTAGFTTQSIPSTGGTRFVALHGARINYMASQALLDRLVFASSRAGTYSIFVCDLDGSNVVQLTSNAAQEFHPEWSPDGTRIVFDRAWSGQDAEIIVMNADGSGIAALTNNADEDEDPTWSPDGRRIAFQSDRDGNEEIYRMYADGSHQTNLTGHASMDRHPAWSPGASNQKIAWATGRHGPFEIYTMNPDGTGPTRLTNDTFTDYGPAWSPNAAQLACGSMRGNWEVYVMTSSGAHQRNFSGSPAADDGPSYSTDGRWIAFGSDRAGVYTIYLQQTDPPYAAFCVTGASSFNVLPDLGSPTMQTERVLVGPSGSDWGGLDPLWSSADAGIVAFGGEGYLNFVRIGIRAADLGSLTVEPLDVSGWDLVGVVVEANEIVNLREDAGRGRDPTVWQLDPLDPGAVVMFFDTDDGSLQSVLAVDDAVYPSGSGATSVVQQRTEGGRLVVEGSFSTVFDGEGNRVAADASAVTISAEGGVVSAE